ncbi:bifunctional protein-serine/threonine kinase/phosphatase [Billgrantia bachuensis]|uniref:Protein kinase n=1 Tax=Billgrantia bachuensis TaxID=2717286 RepID=A0ABX0PUL2_9GAMM|nr:bifunctional protein-serine/threonine kinase/phosphatase [Halomonas bachuensis]NIC06145.1 protein kinase [Halomonas bachuensis]
MSAFEPGRSLRVSLGQCSKAGRKPVNQDFHGAYVPREPQLSSKGVVVALADGISSSDVSQVASESAVRSFIEDYYCTAESWTVKTAAQRVLMATNSWLHAQTRRSEYRWDRDRGYVCTFTALVLKSRTAHIFHVGDARLYRLVEGRAGGALEPLTREHRVWATPDRSYLSRAMGVSEQLEIDYLALPVEAGERFLLMTDGVYEHLSEARMHEILAEHEADLDAAALALVQAAFAAGSDDNLTVQVVRVEEVPLGQAEELYSGEARLPFPPQLEPRMVFDGYRILRQLHASDRSHAYLAVDQATADKVVIKTLATELRESPKHVERFLMEEWIARRIDNPHVVKAHRSGRRRRYLYSVTEFIEGRTLAQWLRDEPRLELETVRSLVEQIARGLRAFHRLEMVHQDLRPHNVMVDAAGHATLIDFGSVRVAGVVEGNPGQGEELLGTASYTAPECFLGEPATPRSDMYSLAVIAYHALTGTLPYGTEVAKARSRAGQHRLAYRSALSANRELPAWVDEVLRKALHPQPERRFEALSELVHELRQPSPVFVKKSRPPLIERDPVLFWKGVAALLSLLVLVLLLE